MFNLSKICLFLCVALMACSDNGSKGETQSGDAGKTFEAGNTLTSDANKSQSDAKSTSNRVDGSNTVVTDAGIVITIDGGVGLKCGAPCSDTRKLIGRPVCVKTGNGNEYAWMDGCTEEFILNPGDNLPFIDKCAGCCGVCKDQGGYKGWYRTCPGKSDEFLYEDVTCPLD